MAENLSSVFPSFHSGYDYEFVLPLDSKYECAICLLALRNPVQTACGHRFCSDCIISSLEDCCKLCPIDKKPLKENELFRDSCVEREILQLKVYCPNISLGCKTTVELKYVEDHMNACSYKPIVCPNECSATVLQRELEDHLNLRCLHRLTSCQHCLQVYPFFQEHLHHANCSKVGVTCDLCLAVIPRNEVAHHRNEICPRVETSCLFVEHGCQHKAPRDDIKKHMEENVDIHLQMISYSYKRMNTLISDILRSVPFSRQASFRHQLSTTSTIPEDTPLNNSDNASDNNSLSGAVELPDHSPLYWQSKRDWDVEVEARECQSNVLNGENLLKHPQEKFEIPQKSPKQVQILREMNDRMIDINQRVVEEVIRLDNCVQKLSLMETNIKTKAEESNGKFCNGSFIWKTVQFSKVCEQMVRNKIFYSPPFWTSPYGYKFCLRANFVVSNDEHFLSLYIHMMQGEFDDVLDWPFQGKLCFSVLDCKDSVIKHHFTECMDIIENLQAFNRPFTPRAVKGYGFKEFLPLNHILQPPKGCFVKNDCFYVKAVVQPFSANEQHSLPSSSLNKKC